MRLFVYGTLMEPACVETVLGRSLPARAARLHGWVRHAPAGGYPYVTVDPDGVVEGLLLDDLDEEALERLDAYEAEGELYRRQRVVVEVEGAGVDCFVYAGAAVVGRGG